MIPKEASNLLAFALLTFAFTANAEVYKCVDNGKTTFSERPCGDSAEVVQVKTTKPTVKTGRSRAEFTDQLHSIGSRVERDKIDRRITKQKARKHSLRRKRDAKISGLRQNINYARYKNDVMIYQNEIADAREEYSNLAREIDADIDDLEKQRDEID
ncbi:MAG: DUF4124 domain-containing protein [Candidatus Thiodiazotropha sp. (ex Troendleina suluensis)]|nr:DUF4124 domain-containing protein [Candidatus Thiodiazotropha sp. (ex Troendleina suluensis)]